MSRKICKFYLNKSILSCVNPNDFTQSFFCKVLFININENFYCKKFKGGEK